MRVIIQRVSEAAVRINGHVKGEIGQGFVLLAGFTANDSEEDLNWISKKIVQMRIFGDAEEKMNLSLQDVAGEILLISQFTLFASTRKGNRPSFINAAPPAIAVPLYEKFISVLEKDLGKKIQTGEFGADMKVSLVNDGPVTIIIDSQQKE